MGCLLYYSVKGQDFSYMMSRVLAPCCFEDLRRFLGCAWVHCYLWQFDVSAAVGLPVSIHWSMFHVMVGDRWLNFTNLQERATCKTCNETESMEHILTKCRAPGRETVWLTVGQIWNRRFKDWDAPSYGEILGCASARLKNQTNRHNKGKTRLYLLGLFDRGARPQCTLFPYRLSACI